MTVAEVRAELGKEVADRPEVVVDHIDHDSEPSRMARVNQALKPRGPAVNVVWSEEIGTVVTPPAIA